jgi:hypothetical protein
MMFAMAFVGIALGGNQHSYPLVGATVSSTGTTTRTAGYELTNAGEINQVVQSVRTDIGDWISPKDSLANYEVEATLLSGSLASGTVGSRLSPGTTRLWTVTDPI